MNNINNCESKKNNVEERKLFSQIKKEKRKKDLRKFNINLL
jgi:hypothetical protein